MLKIGPIRSICAALCLAACCALAASAATDGEIKRKLEAAFDNLEEYAGVEARVESGAVRLRGRVLSESARSEVVELARGIEGVTVVDDEIEVERDVAARLAPVVSRLRAYVDDFVSSLPLFGIAMAIVALFWGVSRLAARPQRLYTRVAGNPLLGELLERLVRLSVLVVGLLLALEVLDATALVGAVLGTAGVAGLAIGFAFRDIIENYVAGILLSVRQPFAPLDFVRIGSNEGKVVRLTSRATVLMTAEGNHLRIPNATVFKETILNYTRNPERRFDFGVGVGMQENLVEVRRLGVGILQDMQGVLAEPEPFSTIEPLGDFSVTIRFYAWVDQSSHDFFRVKSEAIRLVKRAFDAASIDMPEPIQRLRIESGADTPVPQRASGEESSVAHDIGKVDDLDRRIAAERATSPDGDLLDEDAELE